MNSLQQQRYEAIKDTLAQIRAIGPKPEISDAQLEAFKAPLIALASRTELFPAEQFASVESKPGTIYELSVDSDLRYALYASAGTPGKFAPPHNHTTWALISGVFGDEHNVGYERTSETTVEKRWELTCQRGNAVSFQPNDFHTIEVTSKEPALHLHLYGRSLSHLPERVFFKEQVDGLWQGEARRFMAKPEMYSPYVTPSELRVMLGDGEELAVLDVRDGGIYARSHLLTASNVALSQFEMLVPDLLPRLSARIVLVDDAPAYEQGPAQRASAILRRHGYLNLAVLAGGVPAWGAAGYELFSGIFVPSKAFGEVVEHHNDTPRIEAKQLKQWQDEGRKMVVLDSRPMEEYKMMSIPGAAACPGAELVYRLPQLVSDEETTVVVNCAGRTRSIIGAQSLRNAGFKNPIYALKDGTMGWHLSGLKVAKGADNLAPEPQGEALARAKQQAREVLFGYGIETIGMEQLATMRADPKRTTYVFDVRLAQAYREGHIPGSLNAPGGQLVQSTDSFAPVREARIVLVDEHQVQSVMTAHWLKQMGWKEVFVLGNRAVGATALGLEKGRPQATGLGEMALTTAQITAAELKVKIDGAGSGAGSGSGAGAGASGGVSAATLPTQVIDVGASLKYRKSRIPGAWYAIRSRLAQSLTPFDKESNLVFTCSDGRLSRYAASDAVSLGYANAVSLKGGTAAWNHAGFATEASTGDEDPLFLCPTEDVWYRPYDKSAGVEVAMQQYLTWEVNLVEQLKRESYLKFAL